MLRLQAQVAGGALSRPGISSNTITSSVSANSAVTILNTLGESVMSIQLAKGKHPIDLSSYAEGIYFVRTQNTNGISTQRLIISR